MCIKRGGCTSSERILKILIKFLSNIKFKNQCFRFFRFNEKIQKEVWQDKYYKEIIKKLARGESVTDYSLELQAKLLLFKDRVFITINYEIKLDILQKHHHSPLAGDPGKYNTLKLTKRDFYWAFMHQIIKDYVSSFQQCSRNKNNHHKKFGLLKPLQTPPGTWN
ncbi:hypothetical protein O181_036522 [Austropuccinia psidii MF-1]|uniref:Integrase zinc-binding domain-containing protein n=1 Tax=Austropuccinia psidii MF-1 TaxID=1389203 RepID=A0A9Q3D789_9BASI|nr:hypothetical protein [Austropuccinia psidii MF-1]